MAEHGVSPVGGRLTTHVLDTAAGEPAEGMQVRLYRLDGDIHSLLANVRTNADGRIDAPLLEGAAMIVGTYELVFAAGAYLRARHVELPRPAFLDEIPIRFGIADPQAHYHVPLLLQPYGYATYRGS